MMKQTGTTSDSTIITAIEHISVRDGVGTGLGIGVVAALALIGFSVYRLTAKVDLSDLTKGLTSYLDVTKQSLLQLERESLKSADKLVQIEDALKELTHMQEMAMRMSREMAEMILSIKQHLNNAK
jgi:hypothetical protein